MASTSNNLGFFVGSFRAKGYLCRVIPKYPLEALQKLRQEQAEDQAVLLGKAASQTQVAAQAETTARLQRQNAEAQFLAEKRDIQQKLRETAASVADFAAANAWERGQKLKIEELRRTEAKLGQLRKAKEAAEASERQKLATADAQRKLLDQHQGRFQATAKQRQEAALEDAADDLINARHAQKLR